MKIREGLTLPICNRQDLLCSFRVLRNGKDVYVYKDESDFVDTATVEDLEGYVAEAIFNLEDGTEDGFMFCLRYDRSKFTTTLHSREELIKKRGLFSFDNLLLYKLMLINEVSASRGPGKEEISYD